MEKKKLKEFVKENDKILNTIGIFFVILVFFMDSSVEKFGKSVVLFALGAILLLLVFTVLMENHKKYDIWTKIFKIALTLFLVSIFLTIFKHVNIDEGFLKSLSGTLFLWILPLYVGYKIASMLGKKKKGAWIIFGISILLLTWLFVLDGNKIFTLNYFNSFIVLEFLLFSLYGFSFTGILRFINRI
jgi:hypothetical protein